MMRARKEAEVYATAGAMATEVLSSIRTVYTLNGQKYEAGRYGDAIEVD